jgi:3-oxoacyl-(acyl-carrier-protein) synthase
MLSCNAYNNTFVHRGFSFESALLDALLLLKEKEASHVLVGAADEITGYSHAILSRFGMYKNTLNSNNNLYKDISRGSVAGEGASFFLISSQQSATDYAMLQDMATCYKPGNLEGVQEFIRTFLESNQTTVDDLDLVIDGRNGDTIQDQVYKDLAGTTFRNIGLLNYKHLCGEYPTATSFALWSAANILKNQTIPAALGGLEKAVKKIRKILIYNHYQGVHHSLFLISAC